MNVAGSREEKKVLIGEHLHIENNKSWSENDVFVVDYNK